MKENLYAGAAKVCIDPAPELFPFPPFWGVAKEGIYASMYVRVLALKSGETTFVLVCSEFGNASDGLRREASEKYGIDETCFLFCNIHNHGGPYMGRPSGPDDPRYRYIEFFDRQVLNAIGQALSSFRPAKMGYGEGQSYINVNRDLELEDGSWAQANNYDGVSDKTLAVLKIEDMEGKLIAAVLNHCTHANLTFLCQDQDGKSKTCGDFPGFTCDFIEKRYGDGAVVIWTSGAAGDQNAIPCFRGEPHYTGEDLTNFCAPYGLGYRYAQYIGEYHAVDACRVLKNIDCNQTGAELKCADTVVEFEEQGMPKGTNNMLQTLRAQNSVKIMEKLFPDEVKDGRIIDRTLAEGFATGNKIPSQMKLYLIGDVAIVTSEAELYNRIGLLIKEQSPVKNTFVITHTEGLGNKTGYVQDDDSASHPVFQHFGVVRHGHNNEIVLEGVRKLFSEGLGSLS